jgi:hypothetical protein
MIRLLQLDSRGKASLTSFSGTKIPEYAILSHTWVDGEEVTYDDVLQGVGENKSGYDKIRFCAQQAARDGLLYIWIDTCCINKLNLVELDESIRSMFKFYRAAARCYVYLSDVPNPKEPTLSLESAFSKSRWFTRGWTLQELIAPKSVEFFTHTNECIGDRISREQQIHQATGIPIDALRGEKPLSEFSVDDRMSWIARRETTLEEDAAYCLLGLFGIHMPVMYGEGRQHAMDRLQRKIGIASHPLLPISTDVAWIVPFTRNTRFTGREAQLTQLANKLFAKDQPSKIAITGLGGVGKTQLLLELLFQTKEKHKDCSIMWIPATSAESLHQGYLDIARKLGIPGWETEKNDVRKLVQEYLSNEKIGKWLLVFDNADDIDLWITTPAQGNRLIDCLPKSKQGCIVFTSRNRKAAVKLAQGNLVEISEMNEETATKLLQNCLAVHPRPEDQEGVTILLAKLTYLPLAIVQAAAYMNENGVAPADYLSLLAEREEEVIDLLSEQFEDDGRYHGIENPVATTWLISFEQIQQKDPLAVDYLSFLACIDFKDVPQSLLPPGPSRKKEMDALGTLNAYSFVTRRPVDLALDLHRLVHLVMRSWLRKKGLLVQTMEKALAHLTEVFPDNGYRNRSVWRTYSPHARYILESDIISKNAKEKLHLNWKYAESLSSDGRWVEAENWYTQILQTERTEYGLESVYACEAVLRIASTYRNQGRWAEAEQLDMQVLETRRESLGENHPDTLRSLGNLASSLRRQGRWPEAEQMELKVVEMIRKTLGDDHPDTWSSIGNLAMSLRNQGQYTDAERLNVQVLEMRKRLLGDNHPDTLTSISELASTYWAQNRLTEAERLGVQVLDMSKKILGDSHPDTLIRIANLGLVFLGQGRLTEAEQLGAQAVETTKRTLGENHPDTLTNMDNLAGIWKTQGRDSDAVQLMSDCVQRRRRIMSASHPYLVASQAVLARWQREQAHTEKAG